MTLTGMATALHTTQHIYLITGYWIEIEKTIASFAPLKLFQFENPAQSRPKLLDREALAV